MTVSTYYIRGDSAMGDADRSLHAGLASVLLCNNLQHAHEASAFDYCCGPDSLSQSISSSDWAWFDSPPIRVPVRPAIAGGYRAINVSYEAYLGGSGNMTVRTFLLPPWLVNVALDATDAIPDFAAYSDDTVTATAGGTYYDGDITPQWVGIERAYGERLQQVAYVMLRFAAKMNASARTMYLRAPRWKESY